VRKQSARALIVFSPSYVEGCFETDALYVLANGLVTPLPKSPVYSYFLIPPHASVWRVNLPMVLSIWWSIIFRRYFERQFTKWAGLRPLV